MLDERHQAPNYHVFVLRLWQEDSAEWRAVLQETRSGRRVAFNDAKKLIGHLCRLTQQDDPKRSNP